MDKKMVEKKQCRHGAVKSLASALLCGAMVFSAHEAHAQYVPSISGYGGYGGMGMGYGGMGYGGMGMDMGYGIGTGPSPYLGGKRAPANAANSDRAGSSSRSTFGLPKLSNEQSSDRPTMFNAPPENMRNESVPTTDHDPYARRGDGYSPDGYGAGGSTLRTHPAGDYTLDDVADSTSSFYAGDLNDAETSRKQRVVNEANRVGEQAGYSAEAVRLNRWVRTYAADLDAKYNFQRLLNGFVMPPVISEVDTTSERCGMNCLYLTTGSYRIVSEAYVTDRAPSWRDYLFLDAPAVTPPHGLHVKGGDRDLWRSTVKTGWNHGVKRARNKFEENMALLRRDFAGMIRYYELEKQGAISMANVAVERKNGAIYVNGKAAAKGEMRIGLTVTPRFENRQAVAESYSPSSDIP